MLRREKLCSVKSKKSRKNACVQKIANNKTFFWTEIYTLTIAFILKNNSELTWLTNVLFSPF